MLATGDKDLTIRWMDELHLRKSAYANKLAAESAAAGDGETGADSAGNEAVRTSYIENDDEDAEDSYDGTSSSV